MPLGRPIPAVTIDAGMRAQLQAMTRSRSLPQTLTQRAFGLQPHRQKHFKLSTDPFFVEKVRDIVGLAGK
jgi:putative transposase